MLFRSAGGTVSYSLSGTDAAAFNIDSATGVVTIKASPDYETQTSYSFTVKAQDAGGKRVYAHFVVDVQ